MTRILHPEHLSDEDLINALILNLRRNPDTNTSIITDELAKRREKYASLFKEGKNIVEQYGSRLSALEAITEQQHKALMAVRIDRPSVHAPEVWVSIMSACDAYQNWKDGNSAPDMEH